MKRHLGPDGRWALRFSAILAIALAAAATAGWRGFGEGAAWFAMGVAASFAARDWTRR